MFGRTSILIPTVKRSWTAIRQIGFVFFIVSVGVCAAQNTAPGNQAPLREAEALIQKGSFEDARTLLEDQLKLNPSSVDTYNLLQR
jgi:hypothetical protein